MAPTQEEIQADLQELKAVNRGLSEKINSDRRDKIDDERQKDADNFIHHHVEAVITSLDQRTLFFLKQKVDSRGRNFSIDELAELPDFEEVRLLSPEGGRMHDMVFDALTEILSRTFEEKKASLDQLFSQSFFAICIQSQRIIEGREKPLGYDFVADYFIKNWDNISAVKHIYLLAEAKVAGIEESSLVKEFPSVPAAKAQLEKMLENAVIARNYQTEVSA